METLAALRALEDAAVGTRGYVPPDAVDELATALEDLEALSADPSLLLGDNEKEKVEDIVDHATVVLESMNRDRWARAALLDCGTSNYSSQCRADFASSGPCTIVWSA